MRLYGAAAMESAVVATPSPAPARHRHQHRHRHRAAKSAGSRGDVERDEGLRERADRIAARMSPSSHSKNSAPTVSEAAPKRRNLRSRRYRARMPARMRRPTVESSAGDSAVGAAVTVDSAASTVVTVVEVTGAVTVDRPAPRLASTVESTVVAATVAPPCPAPVALLILLAVAPRDEQRDHVERQRHREQHQAERERG